MPQIKAMTKSRKSKADQTKAATPQAYLDSNTLNRSSAKPNRVKQVDASKIAKVATILDFSNDD